MKTLALLLTTLTVITSYGQGVLNESWYLTREGLQAQADMAWGVEVDDNNHVYWATSQSISGFDVKDILLYKIDANGNEIWNTPHEFGGLYEQQAYICTMRDDIVYVGGRTWTGYFSLAFSDALVYAVDTTLQDTLWSFQWDGGYGYEEVDGLVVEDDGIYVTGWTGTDTANQDAFIMKLDLNGNMLWVNNWGSVNYDQQDGHCIVDDSTIYISGLYDLSNSDALLAAFDKTDGSYKWHQLWGGASGEDGLGLGSDGTYLYQCGVTSSHADSTVFLVKYDKNGNIIWETVTNKAIKTRSMAFPNDGSLYLAATSNTLGAGGEDLIIMQYDTATGNLMEYKTWGGAENEVVHDIRIKNNFMYLTGRTWSLSANNFEDALLVKAPLFGATGIDEQEATSNVQVFPNPFHEQTTFQFENPQQTPCLFSLFNAQGQEVYREQNITTQQFTLARTHLQPGMYFYQLSHRDGIVGQGKIVLE